jgi:hypothetical protein
MSQQQSSQQMDSGSVKDGGRDGRLSFRNFGEHQLRKEFKAEAMKKCDLQVGAFAECIQKQGLFAPFKCQEFKNDVNECMAVYNSEERFQLYKKEHQLELDSKPYVRG